MLCLTPEHSVPSRSACLLKQLIMRFSTPHTVFQKLDSDKMVQISLSCHSETRCSCSLKCQGRESWGRNPLSVVPAVQGSVPNMVLTAAEAAAAVQWPLQRHRWEARVELLNPSLGTGTGAVKHKS